MINCDDKIFSVGQKLPALNSTGIVFTNGCFDILHPGHLKYLYEASQLGDKLLVGLNSDNSIMRIIGKIRPFNNFDYRATMLSYFHFIDFIIEFDEDTPEDLIKLIRPFIIVKGGDYKEKKIAGSDYIVTNNGRIVHIDFIDGFSTTKIIEKIKNS